MYSQSGGVKLTVINSVGNEASSPFWDRATSLVKALLQVSPFAWRRLPRLSLPLCS
jgi:hypothetical protein